MVLEFLSIKLAAFTVFISFGLFSTVECCVEEDLPILVFWKFLTETELFFLLTNSSTVSNGIFLYLKLRCVIM